jgi:hypothetical protein
VSSKSKKRDFRPPTANTAVIDQNWHKILQCFWTFAIILKEVKLVLTLIKTYLQQFTTKKSPLQPLNHSSQQITISKGKWLTPNSFTVILQAKIQHSSKERTSEKDKQSTRCTTISNFGE